MKYLLSCLCILTLLFACENSNSSIDSGKTTLVPGAVDGKTKTGYEYVHHRRNKGPNPQVGDEITYHEIVFLNDSLVKSSRYGFEPIKVIMPEAHLIASPAPPSYEAILIMTAKDSMTVYQTIDTVAVEGVPKWLSHGDVLRYEIEMMTHRPKSAVIDALNAVKAREKTVGDSLRTRIALFNKGQNKEKIQTTESGLKYIVHHPGEGDSIQVGRFLQVHYYGALMDGTTFDNTFGKAQPFPFQVGRGRVIKGWDDGLINVKKGGKVTLFIPYKLAYGEAGKPSPDGGKTPAIPERADIAFYVEIIDVR